MNEAYRNIAKICALLGTSNAIISPGSRNAPITMAFAREKRISTFSISDERSAAFIGMGMAQISKTPVVIACTSGTAGYNYAPAIAEAFYQQIPLIVITADRAPEWLDQMDGQTIHQQNLYGKHVKESYNMPTSIDHSDSLWHLERSISEAFNTAKAYPQGPVHINIPFREPFYPDPNSKERQFVSTPKIIQRLNSESVLDAPVWKSLLSEWKSYKKIIIIGGQDSINSPLCQALNTLQKEKFIPIIGDAISNLHAMHEVIAHHELYIGSETKEVINLKPDLIVTFGKSVLSKTLKLFLRKYKPKAHWHIQSDGKAADTFQSLTKIIPTNPLYFFKQLTRSIDALLPEYLYAWHTIEGKVINKMEVFFEKSNQKHLTEIEAINSIFKNLPLSCNIQLANSLSVRLVDYIGLNHRNRNIEIFSNRGTSGIDGCTSTALGAALVSDKTTLLITGDLAFFYDRNAFWNQYIPDNLLILLMNNHGSGIFDMIEGPRNQPEYKKHFLTSQPLTAKSLAKEFKLSYLHCKNHQELIKSLGTFWVRDGKPKLLEIETNISQNTKVLKALKEIVQ